MIFEGRTRSCAPRDPGGIQKLGEELKKVAGPSAIRSPRSASCRLRPEEDQQAIHDEQFPDIHPSCRRPPCGRALCERCPRPQRPPARARQGDPRARVRPGALSESAGDLYALIACCRAPTRASARTAPTRRSATSSSPDVRQRRLARIRRRLHQVTHNQTGTGARQRPRLRSERLRRGPDRLNCTLK